MIEEKNHKTILDLYSGEEEVYGEYIVTVIGKNGATKRKYVTGNILKDILKGYGADLNEFTILEGFDIFANEDVKDSTTIVEELKPILNLFIFGAGHVGRAVALLGSLVGYRTFVLDDREDFLTAIRTKTIHSRVVEFSNLKLAMPFNSAVVIVTRGHQFDELCLKYALNFNLKYVGMIGSRRRIAAIYKRLKLQGISIGGEVKVFSPIGLEIYAKTPMEIAISILAEIIRTVNK